MRMMFASLGIGLGLALSGCAGGASQTDTLLLAARPVPERGLAQFDIASFAAAKVGYPAISSEQLPTRQHEIPAGDYLMSRILEALPPAARDVSLLAFETQCGVSHPVAPRVVCDAMMEVSFDGRQRRVRVMKADLGNAHLTYGAPVGTSAQSFIERQVARLIDRLVDGLDL